MMRRHHAHTIAGSILLHASVILWVGAIAFNILSFGILLAIPAVAFLLAGLRLMWRGELPEE